MKNIYAILKKHKYLIILFVTGILHLWCIYGHVLKNPNNFLSVNDGDGMKNYYAYLTEISDGATNQLSFNYPYGENYLFTDSHPFIARILHYVNKIFPCTEYYSIGILNTFMILNMFFTYLVLFLLIRRFVKQEWYALLWAFAIMLLQPQIIRLDGHLSLSYSLAIPLCFYWITLYYQTNRKILYGILLLVSNFFWLGTHAYLGVMVCAFTFFFDTYQYLFHKEYRTGKDLYWGILKSMAPLALFFAYITLTDIHTGRTTNPYGFFFFFTNLKSIFIPCLGWETHILQKISPFFLNRNWEGIAYIGLVPTLCFWALAFFTMVNLFRYCIKKIWKKLPFEMGLFAPAFFAAGICLLLAMGYPFKLKLHFLLDWFSFIKTFRAMGRFVWPFFFVVTIFTAYAMAQCMQKKLQNTKKMWVYLLFIGAPVFTMMEGIPYQKMAFNKWFRTPNTFLFQNLDVEYQKALKNIKSDEYQAIIPLPFYQGSENFAKITPFKIHNVSSFLAWHFRLPLMASNMTRTSIWESKYLTQMFAPEYYKKLIAGDIPSGKKFLILSIPEENALNEYEQEFLKKATFLLKANDVEFWEIDYIGLTETVTLPYITNFNNNRDALISQNNYLLSQPDSTVFLFSFDTNSSRYKFLGEGAYEQPKEEDYSVFVELEPEKLEESREYEISFWYYVGGENYGQDKLSWMIFISQKNKVSGETVSLVAEGSRKPGNPVVLGNWALAAHRFTIKDKNLFTRFVISITQCKGYQTTLDEILIRPVDVDVYRILEEDDACVKKLYKNGHVIERDLEPVR